MKNIKFLYTLLICCFVPLSVAAKWVKVTDTSLTEGTYAIIETQDNKALSGITKVGDISYGVATKSAFKFENDGAAYSVPEGTMLLTLIPSSDGKFQLKTMDNQYLYIAYASYVSLSLTNQPILSWTYTIPTNNRSYLHFPIDKDNCELIYNDGFANNTKSYYYSNDVGTQLVRKEKDETRSVIANTYATLCLPRAVEAGEFSGAEFYRILYREGTADAPTALILEQVESLEAGVPYIYFTTDTEMSWFLSGPSGTAGNENGLVGTLTKIEDSSILQGKWYISNNEIIQIEGKCTLAANRAYIDMLEVPTQAQATPVPGRKQIRLGQPETATFVPLHHVSHTANKMLLNNAILIQRENHMYDIQGRVIR